MKMNGKKVAIIGAGVSGLVAIKTCLEDGLEPVCFEKSEQIGGLWVYDEKVGCDPKGRAGIYKGLITNVCKEMMAFSDFSYPKSLPPFLKSNDVLQYLQDYAKHFDLCKHIHFNTDVLEVTRAPDYDRTGRWCVRRHSKDQQPKAEIFDAVMMCAGLQASGHVPKVPGLDEFKGLILHSGQFRGGQEFKDKTIVVIGSSHSAGDVAVQSINHAKKVYMSLRDGAYIVPRIMGAQPTDAFANRRWREAIPSCIRTPLTKLLIDSFQDWKALGLQSSKHPVNSSIIMNDELPMKIMSGQVTIRSGLQRFDGSRVIFDDESYLDDVDCVVFATGYNPRSTKTFISDDIISGSTSQFELYMHVMPPRLKHPTLAAIGYIMTRGTLGISSELQSRFAVKVFKGELRLPSQCEMLADIKRRRDGVMRQLGHDKPKIHPTKYNDELAHAIGALPSFWSLLADPKLFYYFYFGPIYPACFRLVGPHSKPDAREKVLQSAEDLLHGVTMKTVRPQAMKRLEDRDRNRTVLLTIVAMCLVGFILAVIF